MTRQHAKELLPIITAYAEGKKIEIENAYSKHDGWRECPYPTFDEANKYRIAPEPDPYAKLKATRERGEVIQFRPPGHLKWIDLDYELWGEPLECYRVKPATKLVPMTSEDLPPVVWLKSRNGHVDLVTSVDQAGYLDGTTFNGPISQLAEEGYLWSADRKTWASMMKEVEG